MRPAPAKAGVPAFGLLRSASASLAAAFEQAAAYARLLGAVTLRPIALGVAQPLRRCERPAYARSPAAVAVRRRSGSNPRAF